MLPVFLDVWGILTKAWVRAVETGYVLCDGREIGRPGCIKCQYRGYLRRCHSGVPLYNFEGT